LEGTGILGAIESCHQLVRHFRIDLWLAASATLVIKFH